ncbi:MAG: response regulator, partial [Nitrospirae bacterium]
MSYILVVDDEESLRYTFAEFLIEEGFSVKTASTVEEAISVLKKALPDVVVADIRLPDGSGIELLDKVKKESHIIPVILITGYPEVKTASEAVRRGAYDYLVKPVRQETLTHVVRLSKRQKELAEEKERYRANLEALFLSIEDGIVIVDSDMRILQINQGVEKICGFFKDEVSGKKHDTLKRDCGGRCSELLARSISERMVCMETALRCFHVGRANQVVNIKSFPLFWGGGFKGGVMLIRDVTFYSKDTRVEDQWRFHKLIGKTEVMNKLYRTIESVSDVDSTVLITGETG